MALFKILKGQSADLSAQTIREGYCYVTTDEHKMYIDTETERFALNAAYAEKLSSGTVGDYCHPVYFNNGIPETISSLKIGNNLELWSDDEGGNILLRTPDANFFELDNFDNNLRIYRNDGSQWWKFGKDGSFHSTGHLLGNASLYLYQNNRTVGLSTDTNGNSNWVNYKDDNNFTQITLTNETVGTNDIGHIYRKYGGTLEDYVLLHAGNYSSYALPLTGGTMIGDLHMTQGYAIHGVMGGGSDHWYLRGEGADDNGYLSLTLSDNGDEFFDINFYNLEGYSTSTFRTTTAHTWIFNDFYVQRNSTNASSLWVLNQSTNGVRLRADTEGGNINIYSGNGHTNFWEIDSYNGDLRFYTWRESDGNYSGSVRIAQESGVLYGAAWNDYAEYRSQEQEIEPGYIVISSKNGNVKKASQRLSAFDGVVSDTFGFAIGETEECKTPLAIAGRVLVYCEGDRDSYEVGDVICASENGKACKMTREEINQWPDRIVGTVSEIPSYDTWGQNSVKVNGRIWIKVK